MKSSYSKYDVKIIYIGNIIAILLLCFGFLKIGFVLSVLMFLFGMCGLFMLEAEQV